MTTPNIIKVRVIMPDGIVELEGTPEEVVQKVESLIDIQEVNIIEFPPRGIYAHPAGTEYSNG